MLTLAGQSWKNSTLWLSSASVCDWNGVGCNDARRVSSIILSGNFLVGPIPESFGQLTSLTVLTLTSNSVSALPSSFGNLTLLQTLNLDTNALTSLPASINNCTKLTRVTINRNQLTSLPSVTKWNLVTYFDASDNKITQLPDLSGLTSVGSLILYNNSISSLPTSMCNMNFGYLDVSSNRLSTLPSCLSRVPISTLTIDNNPLIVTPPVVSELITLRKLSMSNCNLMIFPNVTALTQLSTLYISHNLIGGEVDSSISFLKNLSVLGRFILIYLFYFQFYFGVIIVQSCIKEMNRKKKTTLML